MPTQQERRDATQAAILAAAVAEYSAAGHALVSVEAIANRAGVAKSTLLYHFGSRDELLQSVVVELVTSMESAIAGRGLNDVESWTVAVLETQHSTVGRLLFGIGDDLATRGALESGDPLPYLVGRLRDYSVGNAEVIGAAMLQFGRELACGRAGLADVATFASLLAESRQH